MRETITSFKDVARIDLQPNLCLTFFYELLRIRLIEEEIGHRYAEQQMRCPVHLSIGQEAIAVGVCQQLQRSDYLIGNHRAHAHYLAKGGSLQQMMAEIYGKVGGCRDGRGGSMHLMDLSAGIVATTPIVGGSIPIGVGMALASKLKKEEQLTVIFFGEGATEEGVWAESLNFAALRQLPVLFVCENNFYSVYSPLSVRQPERRSRVAIAAAHGIFTREGHGNNVEEVYQITGEAVAHIRAGRGPAFIEFDTYRYREHCGPNNDDNAGYRPLTEVAHWQGKCPLQYYERELRHRGLLTDGNKEEMRAQITKEIEEAFAFAKESPFPAFELAYNQVYA